jgi:GT2 family glycosyltransferase
MISLAVLTYNRRDTLKELLLSLERIKARLGEIIVVDNHSEDGTEEMVRVDFPLVDLIRTEENMGATARNLGLQRARGDIVITMDDDIIGITAEDLDGLIFLFEQRPELGAVNFQVRDYFTGSVCNWVHHRPAEKHSGREFLTYEITEGAVAFRKNALERVGYYPEYFFISHEGPDLAFRLMNQGYTVLYSPTVAVRHKHSSLGRKEWMNYYYDTRNQLWLATRNFPWSYSARYLARGLGSMLLYSLRDGYFRCWGRGIIDGLKGIQKAFEDRKTLRPETMEKIREIDKERAGTFVLLRQRLTKKGARL